MCLPYFAFRSCFRRALALFAIALFCGFPTGTATAVGSPQARAESPTASAPSAPDQLRANFRGGAASAAARQVADWIVASGDNRGLAFVIVDKVNARLFLFDAGGTVRAAVPVLVGLARGDDSPAGIGTRPLSAITPGERITPAGRFVAEPGQNLSGKDILWVDYAAAISLHRASDRKPGMTAKSRVERLTGATGGRRISYGCINVSAAFYDDFVRPAFSGTTGIVYILPETRSARAEFRIPDATIPVRLATSTTAPRDVSGDAGPAAAM
jgi:hypothetical protein